MEKKYYSTGEIGEILGVQQRTVYTYLSEGKLPAVKIGRYWRIPKAEFDAMMEAKTQHVKI